MNILKLVIGILLVVFISACSESDGSSLTTTTDDSDTITHNGISYNTVTSPFTGRVWLDRNLGASRVCIDVNDTQCFGDYYQWGRAADGHEKIDSNLTSTLANTIEATHGDFIFSSGNEDDWTTDDFDGSLRIFEWSKIDGVSICPSEYKVPTFDEASAELVDLNMTNAIGIMDNFLKLPLGGSRDSSGQLDDNGLTGKLSTTTVLDPNTYRGLYSLHYVEYDSGSDGIERIRGITVRCIKD